MQSWVKRNTLKDTNIFFLFLVTLKRGFDMRHILQWRNHSQGFEACLPASYIKGCEIVREYL
jgi:hypothetical protein